MPRFSQDGVRVVNGIVDDFVHRLGKKSDYRWPVTRKSPRCPLKAKHVRAAAHALLRGDLADGALCSDEASAVGGCKVVASQAGLLHEPAPSVNSKSGSEDYVDARAAAMAAYFGRLRHAP